MTRPIVIGAGHNGLTAAFYLARAGLKPLVLEARDEVGGGAITGELHPGFRCPTLAHHASIWAEVIADMDLLRRGVEFLTPPVELFAPGDDGGSLTLRADMGTAGALATSNERDAAAYVEYRAAMDRIATVLGAVLAAPPPDIDSPAAGDLWSLLAAGIGFRRLGRRDGYRLLRWIPMPVADFTSEWFSGELLRASIAAPGLSGTMLGPRSAGSTLVLMLQHAHRLHAQGRCRIRGGPGALTNAMAAAARDAGAETLTGTPVNRILVKDGRVAGVTIAGRELPATTVVSAVDPKTTLLRLVDPADLTPDLLSKASHYRARGTMAKVNLALSGLPRFTSAGASGSDPGPIERLSGRIHVGPDLDYLERAFDHAKYGELSSQPWLDVTIPSILDPDLAPPGAHVMSIYAHYAPYHLRGDWAGTKPLLLERVLETLDRFAPGIRGLVIAAQVISPLELETRFGFHGGDIFHGELALDQLLMMRPLLGYGRYAGPIQGLYMCGAGTHPGGFLSGASGRLAARVIARAAAP